MSSHDARTARKGQRFKSSTAHSWPCSTHATPGKAALRSVWRAAFVVLFIANLFASRFWPRQGFRPATYRFVRRIDARIAWRIGEKGEPVSGLIALVGGNEFRRDCEPMDRELLARFGAEPKVVIVPTAAARENPGLAAENGMRHFRRLGAQAEAAMVVDAATAQQASFTAQIRDADLVYFTGGDPAYLLETMRSSAAWKAALEMFDRGGLIAGSSAGAMICGGQMWAPGHGWRDGLGLVPKIVVIPHHATLAARWDADRLRATLPADITLVGVDEATALVGLALEWQVLGRGEVAVYRGESPSIWTNGQIVRL
jgi:cyanophycinase